MPRCTPRSDASIIVITAVLAALYLLVWPEAVLAQAPQGANSINGRVLEAGLDDYGVPGVTVRVVGTQIKTTTDESGYFTLKNVPAGPVELRAQAPDYASTTRTISAKQRDEPVTLTITWAGKKYSAVTVALERPRRRPQTASTTRLTPREINAAPHRNAEDILRQVPGLTLVQHGSEGKGHQFFLRGFDAIHGADLEITVNGISLNEWSNVHAQGYLDLALIIPEFIRSVVVTKGPFTLTQGAFAMAGSADYRLGVSRDTRGWRAAYTLGSTNRHRIFAGYSPSDGEGKQFVGVEATHDEGFGENRQLDRATFNGRVRLFEADDGARLYLLGLGNYSEFELPTPLRNDDIKAGRIGFYDSYDPLTEGRSARGLAALNYERRGAVHELSVTAYGGWRRLDLMENYTGFFFDPAHGDRRGQFQRTWTFGFFGVHGTRLTQRLALRLGAGLRGDIFKQREQHIGRNLEVLGTRRNLSGAQFLMHAFAGFRWRPTEAIRVDAGARIDVVDVQVTDHLEDAAAGSGTLWTISPRATARWQVADYTRLFASYGRGFRPPEARAFSSFEPEYAGYAEEIYTGGEPRITVADAFELGGRWDPSLWFGMSLAGFATFIERESVYDHISGTSLELNGTRRVGAEWVVYSDPLPWLSLSADATVVDAKFVESGNRVPNAPWLTGGFHAMVTHQSGFRAGLRTLVVAPRPLPHGAIGATLIRVDATLGYRWRWLRVNLEIENLLDSRLREGEYHYRSYWQLGRIRSAIPVLHTTAGAPLNARLTLGVQF